MENAFAKLRFRRPLVLAYPPDGTDRIVVVEQDGVVHIFENRSDVAKTTVALDIRAKVRRNHEEEGLLGLAFHPKFRDNREVFLQYSATPRRNVISRFRMDAERTKIVPEPEEVILEIAQPFGNHNGGMIDFGPDGHLYIALGDGGAAADPFDNGQNGKTLLGKILRIDVDRKEAGKAYAIPVDNPFVGKAGFRPEVWAWGLRNVWRFSFDRKSGALWAGDVGQNTWEEVDVIEKGKNYGWAFREGNHPFKRGGKGPFEPAVWEHDREEARSITGGYVYRGKRHKELEGVYLYGDYETGLIWGLRYDGERVTDHRKIAESTEISTFGEDRDGEVYFTSFDGHIYRLRPRAGGE